MDTEYLECLKEYLKGLRSALEGVAPMYTPEILALTAERDQAIRERNEARAEVKRLRVAISAMSRFAALVVGDK